MSFIPAAAQTKHCGALAEHKREFERLGHQMMQLPHWQHMCQVASQSSTNLQSDALARPPGPGGSTAIALPYQELVMSNSSRDWLSSSAAQRSHPVASSFNAFPGKCGLLRGLMQGCSLEQAGHLTKASLPVGLPAYAVLPCWSIVHRGHCPACLTPGTSASLAQST